MAKAIARAIKENPTIKVVGLLGKWGSGKSTIIKEVSVGLSKDNPKHLTFAYDAWLHQHDPLRRSFFESLVNFLIAKGVVERKCWERRSKELSGELDITDTYETPIITKEAKLFAILLAIFAFGLSFLDGDALADGFGKTTTEAGIWTLRIGIILPVISIASWLFFVGLSRFFGKRVALIPAIIVNKTFEHNHTEVVRSLDATSIEFGSAFRDLMKEVAEKHYRTTIVVDNIDRVNETEALEIWANVRSFFLSSQDDNEITSEDFHPTVILPVDYRSLAKIFSVGNDASTGSRLARSFISKTFDATFNVPTPVLSNWKLYLAEKMRFALENEYDEEKNFVTRKFVERWFDTKEIEVTPRELNQIINQIVSLMLQWEGGPIPFPVIAYYAIQHRDIDNRIEEEIQREDHPLAELSADWARQLAALYFGVGLGEAAQVLMSQPIRDAIRENDADGMAPYRKVSGFGDALEQATRDLPLADKEREGVVGIILNAVLLLDGDYEEGPWLDAAKRNLVEAFKGIKPGSSLPKNGPAGVKHLYSFAKSEDALDLVQASERLLDTALSQKEMTIGELTACASIGGEALRLAEKYEVRQPIYDLRADAQIYLTRVSKLHEFPSFQSRVRTNADFGAVKADILRRLQAEDDASSIHGFRDLIFGEEAGFVLREDELDFSEIYTVSENLLRNSAPSSEVFKAAIAVLVGAGRNLDVRKEAMARLSQDNSLQSKLPEIVALNDKSVIGGVFAFLIDSCTVLDVPADYTWGRFLKNRPGLADEINRQLDRFFDMKLPVDLLLAFYEASYKNIDLAKELMALRVKSSSLGRLNPGRILGNFSRYAKLVDWRSREDFATILAEYSKFWPNLRELPWSKELFEAAQLIVQEGGDPAERVCSELMDRLGNATVDEWLAAISKGEEPYRIAYDLFGSAQLRLGVKSNLAKALDTAVPALSRGDNRMRMRWFHLSMLVTPQAKKRAFLKLRDGIFTLSPKDKIGILKEGGGQFIAYGDFQDEADRSIRDVLIPLTRSKPGRKFLKDLSAEFRPCVREGGQESVGELRTAINDIERSGKEGTKHWAEVLKRNWGL